MNAYYECTISVLKVMVVVCRVCGCGTTWETFIFCITEKMTAEMLCFIIYNFCIFSSLFSAFFPHPNYC